MEDPLFDVIIGNIEGARAPYSPDPQWGKSGTTPQKCNEFEGGEQCSSGKLNASINPPAKKVRFSVGESESQSASESVYGAERATNVVKSGAERASNVVRSGSKIKSKVVKSGVKMASNVKSGAKRASNVVKIGAKRASNGDIRPEGAYDPLYGTPKASHIVSGTRKESSVVSGTEEESGINSKFDRTPLLKHRV